MRHSILKRFIWVIVFAVLLYTAFFIWSDLKRNIETLRAFPWRILPVILAAVTMNFLLRELKWDYYRRAAGIRVPRLGSFLVFFSGFSMAISPGRIGELIKPFMYKEYFGQKMRRSIPLVFCERVSDLLGMIVLGVATVVPYMATAGSGRFTGPITTGAIYAFLALSVVTMVVLVGVLRSKRMMYRILIGLGRRRRLAGPMSKLRKLYHRTYPLLTARNLAVTTAMASVSWFFECVAVLLILHGVGATGVTLPHATFIFCMATILGGFFFFLPGGLGGFEPTMIGMLALLGVAKYLAVPAVFIARASTLFFSVALGFVFILVTSAFYRKTFEWDQFERADTDEKS